ncbi:MAG: DUF4474 domain-containing protein [Peptococcaceae bacterium]|nr:DUF4474 domain-containing protein [Peptococcaceae bacterium]
MSLLKKKRSIDSHEETELHSSEGLLVHPGGEALRQGVMLEETGFAYDAEQDIFYSVQEPWQRQYGYCRFYDVASPFMSLIFDSEPIRFDYDGKHWLIEFWKGQYGMTTGCEIGVYAAEEDSKADREFWREGSWSERAVWGILRFLGDTLYRAVDPKEQLLMSMTMMKNNEVLFTRKERHWWLTGFVLGEFSEPEELTARFRITLKTRAMRQAFVEALGQRGYDHVSILADGKTVEFVFDTPYSFQPITRRGVVRMLAQANNRSNCEMYHDLTQGSETKEALRETYKSL